MHVLGHDDPGDQFHRGLFVYIPKTVDERIFDIVIVEELKAMTAGKCQETDTLWILVAV